MLMKETEIYYIEIQRAAEVPLPPHCTTLCMPRL